MYMIKPRAHLNIKSVHKRGCTVMRNPTIWDFCDSFCGVFIVKDTLTQTKMAPLHYWQFWLVQLLKTTQNCQNIKPTRVSWLLLAPPQLRGATTLLQKPHCCSGISVNIRLWICIVLIPTLSSECACEKELLFCGGGLGNLYIIQPTTSQGIWIIATCDMHIFTSQNPEIWQDKNKL